MNTFSDLIFNAIHSQSSTGVSKQHLQKLFQVDPAILDAELDALIASGEIYEAFTDPVILYRTDLYSRQSENDVQRCADCGSLWHGSCHGEQGARQSNV